MNGGRGKVVVETSQTPSCMATEKRGESSNLFAEEDPLD